MKFWTTEHIFPHSWTKVTEASWRKYNVPLSEVLLPHVLATDVIDRSVSDNGVMSSTRLFTVESVIPSWIRPIIGVSESCGYVYETSEVDPRQKIMVLRSKNITLNNYVSVEETCTYTQLDDNTTHFKQECQISANISYLASRAETAVMDSFKKGAEKGRDTVEKVCHFIDTEVAEVEKALESVLHLERPVKSNDDSATE
ncbi:hypothetical protein SARC_04799 [Sphaeroforma arctica JP610]|uniref:PRELI/MSF1 domain-containing protein n=1 Tax=Sphaeroforma arctica JP610 TaxID=667725 RepID=A0A0L0G1A2_9EUKA|nr:hypothetical protein SARC_04799 [Sphaeroforma arctica JP610]KNC82932.1 hypothetical protein SARC_04799 [Sphaeroforma arctica JP610]|eukprot:XP_014156834.1 hypothetical protein SARC_04799 [Sphaeroforma arctica JP610]